MTKNKFKKVMFDDTDVRHAQLKVRLEYHELSQSEFFRSFITGYLEKDSLVMEYINKYKQHVKKHSLRKLKRIDRDDEKAIDLLGKFGIRDDELENIFDVIAKEHPD